MNLGLETLKFIFASMKASPFIRRLEQSEENLHRYAEIAIAPFLGEEVPRQTDDDLTDAEQWYWERVHEPAQGIFNSRSLLSEIASELKLGPRRGRNRSRVGHLRCQIRIYVQEASVLRNRLARFIGSLEKDYRNSPGGEFLSKNNAVIRQFLSYQFKVPAEVRNRYVHAFGFEDGLGRLGSMESWLKQFREAGLSPEVFVYVARPFVRAYRSERRKWIDAIALWEKHFDNTLDQYFGYVNRALFTSTGEMIYPTAEMLSRFTPRSASRLGVPLQGA